MKLFIAYCDVGKILRKKSEDFFSPYLTLADEPTTYLDMTHQLEVLELLENLNKKQKKTIAMVLHDLNLAARFSDWMIAMRSGRVLYKGTPEEIMTKKTLADVLSLDASISRDPCTGKPICLSYKRMDRPVY